MTDFKLGHYQAVAKFRHTKNILIVEELIPQQRLPQN